MSDTQNWVVWALLSAIFAALTAIFAKAGLERVDSDYATLIRTALILLVVSAMVGVMGKWQDPRTLPPRSLVFLDCRRWPPARHGCVTSARSNWARPRAWRPSTS